MRLGESKHMLVWALDACCSCDSVTVGIRRDYNLAHSEESDASIIALLEESAVKSQITSSATMDIPWGRH